MRKEENMCANGNEIPGLSARNIFFSHEGKRGKNDFFSDLSFHLPPGKMTVLAGGNGCGKSTLLKILCGRLGVKSGVVSFDGTPLKKLSSSRRGELIGLVPQELPRTEEMTVWDLVMTGRLARRSIFGLPVASSSDVQAVEEILRELDMLSLAERRCSSLSGGEFRRAAIGATLVRQLEILLLDEPCAALDYRHEQELMELLERLRKERSLTILLVSHDLTLAARFGTNFVLMKEGAILARGLPEEVLTPETLEKVYDIPFQILRSSGGFPVPLPGKR